MVAWYATLNALEQGFALVAIAASTLLFLQTGMQLIGFGAQALQDGDVSPDFEAGDGAAIDTDISVDAEVDVSFEAPDFAEIDSIELDLPEADMIELPAGEALEIDSETLPHGITTSDSMPANDPGLRLFTMRSLVAFFALAGWSGLIALQNRWGLPMVFAAAFVAGAIGSYTVAKIMQLALRLQDKGNINLENAISMQAEVYIRIPASTQGVGKVTLVIQERFLETDAVTRHTADLHPGESVRVVGLQDENTLIVRPI